MARDKLKTVCRLIDSANIKPTPEQSFLSDLKRSIELDSRAGARKPSKSYKPSSMNCIRNMWYQMMGVEPDEYVDSYQSTGISWSGIDTHLRIQAAVTNMQSNGFDCEYVDVAEYVKAHNLYYLAVVSQNGPETKLYHTDLHMSFMCDGIILYKGKYYILEIKSESSYKFQQRTGVDEKHYNQGIAYAMAFNIRNVMFLYVNRDLFDLKCYLFTTSDEQYEMIVGTITDCDGYVARMICPPKPENIPRRICEYCGYKERCKSQL